MGGNTEFDKVTLQGGINRFGTPDSYFEIGPEGETGYGGNAGKWSELSIGATQLHIPTASLAVIVDSGPSSTIILEETGDNLVYANFVIPEDWKQDSDIVVGFMVAQTTDVDGSSYKIRASWEMHNPDVVSANGAQTITIPTALNRVGLLQSEFLSHVPSTNVEAGGPSKCQYTQRRNCL